jgi:hypothetical protein
MNYKIMQRPMFRLGGKVRQNYESGTSLADIEKLIQERAGLREKAIGGIRSALPFQVLAGQMDDIRTIRKPGDILNILSNVGSSPELFGALTKLPSLDLKMKEGELTDQITLAKLKRDQLRSTDYLRKKGDLKLIQEAEDELRRRRDALDPKDADYDSKLKAIERENTKLQERKAQTVGRLRTRAEAVEDFKKSYQEIYGALPSEDKINEEMRKQGFLSSGGRVGFQEGTPMPMPKPQEAVQDRQLNTLMEAAPGLENAGEVKGMMMKDEDIYAALRRRLPQEITDDVVRLIAYNAEAFADFADISDQSDVDSFNEKYNVQLVLPVENVT